MMIYTAILTFIIILVLGIITYFIYNMFIYKKEGFVTPSKNTEINDLNYLHSIWKLDNMGHILPSTSGVEEKYYPGEGQPEWRRKYIVFYSNLSKRYNNKWTYNSKYKVYGPVDIDKHNYIIKTSWKSVVEHYPNEDLDINNIQTKPIRLFLTYRASAPYTIDKYMFYTGERLTETGQITEIKFY